MKRIMIIGSGGSGKSTLARQIGRHLRLPVFHLDAYYWKPGWVPTPNEEWDKFLERLVLHEEWIIDGNYGRTIDIRLQKADVVLFMDLPTWISLYRVIKRRVMYHGKTRPDLNEGCPEKLDFAFLKWVWNFRKDKRPAIMDKLQAHAREKTIVIIRTRSEAQRLLEGIEQHGAAFFSQFREKNL
jgi:adenylate kinase family enzyme